MVSKLTVIFFILVCLQAGILLVLLPWVSIGVFGDWGDNYLLAFIAQKTGLPILQQAVASNWFRGAVTGLGVLNLFIAFWEMAHFRRSVQMLGGKEEKKIISEKRKINRLEPDKIERADNLPDYDRRSDSGEFQPAERTNP
jgi:hypothetical protein